MNWILLSACLTIEVIFGTVCFVLGALSMKNFIETLPDGTKTDKSVSGI